jgi:hypothetical protein
MRLKQSYIFITIHENIVHIHEEMATISAGKDVMDKYIVNINASTAA